MGHQHTAMDNQECQICDMIDRMNEMEREINALTDEVNYNRGFMSTLSERIDELEKD
jgi:archaellum component FlaC